MQRSAELRLVPPPSQAPVVAPLTEIDVKLPSALRRFGNATRATIVGPPGAPAIVVLGGISANRFPCVTGDGAPGWWSGLAGAAGAADPATYRIIGFDFAADEAGRLAPSTRDQAEVVCAVLDAFGVARAHAIIGASYGGMTALAVGEHFAERCAGLVIVSAPAEPHPTSTALRELQRRVVAFGLDRGSGAEGLALARGLAMLTYRCPQEFEQRFRGGIVSDDAHAGSAPGDYLRARGEAYNAVMSPGRFISLSASIDRHRVDPAAIHIPALIIGATTDQLVPPGQLSALASFYGGEASLHLLPSIFGHDMFLKQADQVSALAAPFLRAIS